MLTLKVDPPDQLSDTNPTEVVLPQALEDVLALKNQRALELGTDDVPEDTETKDENESDDGEETMVENREKSVSSKSIKNKRKKKKKKNRNRQKKEGIKEDESKQTNLETGEKDVEVE